MSANSIMRIAGVALWLMVLTACTSAPPKPPLASPEANTNTELSQADYRLALTEIKEGKDDDALASFKKLAQSHPKLAAPYINIGLIELKKGDLQAAEAAMINASTLQPELAVIHNGLGVIYRRLGRFAEAEAAYLRALQCQPDYANAHLNLAILYDIYLNKFNAALVQYQRYQTLTGGSNDLVNKWIIDVKQRLAATTGSS
jgi:Flp pilus assembly protein TadD